MSMLLSHSHVECVLNGERIREWADEEQPYDFEEDDFVQMNIGRGGQQYGIDMSSLGGRLVLRLAPHSKSVKWLMQQGIDRKTKLMHSDIGGSPGYATTYNGTLVDYVTGLDITMKGGVIVKIPSRTIAGQTFEVTFQFEQVVSNIEGNEKTWRNIGEYSDSGSSNPTPPGLPGLPETPFT